MFTFLLGTTPAQQSTYRPEAHANQPSNAPRHLSTKRKHCCARDRSKQAKEKIQEQLKLNPSSVEGYNLLGIIYSERKGLRTTPWRRFSRR